MKTYLLLLLLPFCLITQSVYGQSGNQNYVSARTMTSATGSTYIDKIDYFDGLGRPMQTIQVKAGGSNQDLVTQIDYDSYGRKDKVWLPSSVAGNNGAYVAPATARSGSVNTNGSDSKPYSLSVYEPSPLNRVTDEYGPGNTWHANSRGVHTTYLSNNSSYVCGKYTSSDDGFTLSITRSGAYPIGELYVTKLQDEDNNVSYEFKDKLGQTILTRQVNGSVNFDTYYVYDNYGNLRAVLPPLASDVLSSNGTYTESNTTLQKYGYLYKYDGRNRCVAKKLPGAEWCSFVYDNADRLIFSQDGEQRARGEWTFTIPDAFGRPALIGICTNSLNYSGNPLSGKVVSAAWASTGSYKGYNITGGVTPSGYTLQTVNYYDQYEFIGKNGVPATLNFEIKSGYATANHATPKGLPTGQITSQLGNGSVLYYSANYYDIRGRLILTKSTNHLSGMDKEFVAYAFDGLPEKRFHEHSVSGGSVKTEEYAYTYDDARRLKTTSHKLNGATTRVLSARNYDLVGRLQDETLGEFTMLKSTYTHDIRSRVTWKGDAQMSESLTYTYGSNIGTQTITMGTGARKYEFAYDGLSRLTSVAYTSGPGNYATSYSYDKQGNPGTIKRYGMTSNGVFGLVDDLSFSYDGNRVTSVNDAAGNIPYSFSHDFKNYTTQSVEYSYNANGAMSKDLNRGISSIQYNILNLPSRIEIKSPVGEARNEYVYRSDGEKLRVLHRWNPSYSSAPVIGSAVTESSLTSSETTDYIGNYVYENNTLKRILTENGYVENGIYHFYVNDHLGSNRLVVCEPMSSQAVNYYPFGMANGDHRAADYQSYKYTGKELDMNQGLNLYDYGARYYDPGTGRFTSMDPLAEKYYSISPYAYCANNPMKYIDPDGKKIVVGSMFGRFLAYLGFNTFEFKVEKQIAQLKSMDSELKTTIEYLQNSEMTVRIHPISILRENKGNYTKPNSKNLTLKQGSLIGYDPDNYITNQSNKRPPIIGLMHEFGYAENYLKGESTKYNKKDAAKGITPDVEKGNKDEYNSIRKENIVRKKLNINERDYEYYKKNN